MRVIGLDVHRNFAQVAILDAGLVKDHGRFVMEREAVLAFAHKVLTKEDDVVLEATGNTAIIVRLLTPFVRRVVIANPLQVRAIAWAKVKTDKIDAATLARLHAANFLPEVWMPPEDVELQRRVIAERTQLVGQMTRLKNRIQSILHANLVPKETGIFSKRGRARLEALPLAADQMRMALRHHDELGRLAAELAIIDRDVAQRALADPNVKRLMTIGGVDAIVAASVLAAIGDICRFSSPEKLVSYLGLNPSVHQSGDHPAYHGHITHQGRGHARGMLVEAAWSIASSSGPLSAFFHRISVKRCKSVAAIATARKLAVLIWHMLTKQQDYVWVRPALLQFKMRRLELMAGHASRRGGNKPGPARDYSVKAVRDQERARLASAEQDYRSFVAGWRERPPAKRRPALEEGKS
jgi:transposase